MKYFVQHNESGDILESDECFVIRATDVFAAQALYGYAHLVQSALELNTLPSREFLSPAEKQSLEELTENLSALADRWRFKTKKVPT
jgi:hypothetical protein